MFLFLFSDKEAASPRSVQPRAASSKFVRRSKESRNAGLHTERLNVSSGNSGAKQVVNRQREFTIHDGSDVTPTHLQFQDCHQQSRITTTERRTRYSRCSVSRRAFSNRSYNYTRYLSLSPLARRQSHVIDVKYGWMGKGARY